MKHVTGYVERYTNALYDLKSMNGQPISSHKFAKDHKISTAFMSGCRKMGIVKAYKDDASHLNVYVWTGKYGANRSTAIELASQLRQNAKKSKPKPKEETLVQTKINLPEVQKTTSRPQAKEFVESKKTKTISIFWGLVTIKTSEL
jgi:hypothetical protein